jgi:MOSC domain-containing protein YiiM
METPTDLKQLMANHAKEGRVMWIGLRPARREEVRSVGAVTVDPVTGLDGDHYQGKRNKGRQVTLIQAEHLEVVERLIGHPVSPALLRRNLVVAGVNLLAFKGQLLEVGTATFRITGHCHPCSRMEEALGRGGYNAMRGHGGVTAQVVRGGVITAGDAVRPVQDDLFGIEL